MKDILLNSASDLLIVNADLVIGESAKQQAEILFFAEKGSFKQTPDIGVGASSYLESENKTDLLREIKVQCEKDGLNVNITNGQPIIISN